MKIQFKLLGAGILRCHKIFKFQIANFADGEWNLNCDIANYRFVHKLPGFRGLGRFKNIFLKLHEIFSISLLEHQRRPNKNKII